MPPLSQRFDYVVVGAGSAGCVVAARLSEDPSTRVLLLEAGGKDRGQEFRIPAAFSKLFHTDADWDYRTVPQAGLDNRALYWPRGKVLGGSSSINAMMWVRGVPADFDEWAAAGNPGWSYSEVLPYFQRAEHTERHDPDHTGRGGPITVEEQRHPNPGTRLFVETCQVVGIPLCVNPNGGGWEGVSLTQVSQRRGRRLSSADGYLRPALRRPNLTVATGALATRVMVDGGWAVGVTYTQAGEERVAEAEREVVLCGGTVNSPQLLLLSGIGPGDHLRAVGIDPLVDLPGVGSGLVDHLAAGIVRATSRTDTLVAAETPAQMARYLTRRRGMLTSPVGEAHAFIRSASELEWPDLELIFAPVPYLDHGDTPPPAHGYTIGVILLQPDSTGTIRLASGDPGAAPQIDPAYLSEPADLDRILAGLQTAELLFESPPLSDVITGWIRPEHRPGSRAEWTELVRRYAETLYHPAGTCRMGDDAAAVVDAELRVHGMGGLRVADVSVMPRLNRGHTNAVAVMIGERAADLIRAGA